MKTYQIIIFLILFLILIALSSSDKVLAVVAPTARQFLNYTTNVLKNQVGDHGKFND
ncbi:hypothetical protein [Glaesserella parasuis]|uniref:hypothetical protein n=1 Tax=Glaesserella parasuis TaxID=738 RepID=UPI0003AC0B0B|nr:hypothetical protein [Glaesserella parasuis]EQA03235.1 hypothetical protein HPSNAG_0555 [Glaesserella parasuis str. Nagasaki]